MYDRLLSFTMDVTAIIDVFLVGPMRMGGLRARRISTET